MYDLQARGQKTTYTMGAEAMIKKISEQLRKRRLLKACGRKCGTCPYLKSHWDGKQFLGLSCLKGAW